MNEAFCHCLAHSILLQKYCASQKNMKSVHARNIQLQFIYLLLVVRNEWSVMPLIDSYIDGVPDITLNSLTNIVYLIYLCICQLFLSTFKC